MGWRGPALRIALCVAAFAAAAGSLGATNGAGAAELFVDAPGSCVDPAGLVEEVSDLVGRPLGSVPDVDFRIAIAHLPRERWRLRLEAVARRPGGDVAGQAFRREIEGDSCSDLADAAAVAIAVSIRAAASPEGRDRAPSPASAVPAAPAAGPTAAPVIAASAAAPGSAGSGVAPRGPWTARAAMALVGDLGALPGAGAGIDLEGSLQHGPVRLTLLATWFPSRDSVAPDGTGGSFDLALGAGLLCLAPRWGRWTPLGCAGFELGRLAGSGLGVPRPSDGVTVWTAARVDVGVEAALGGGLALLLRGGVGLPTARPEFVLDGVTPVYRASALVGRLTAGIAVGF